MSDDRIDFSALAPGARWEAGVQRTLRRVEGVLPERARGDDPFAFIAQWRRPLLAAAAAVIALLVPVEWALERRETGAERVRSLVQLSAEAVRGEPGPTGAQLLSAVSPWSFR